MAGALDLDVLVVSYNSASSLSACFDSIRHVAPMASIAVREHGDDPTALRALQDLATRQSPPVRLEHDPSNPGFGAGCNALAAASAATHLLFLNPDAELITWPWSDLDPPPIGAIVGPMMVDSGDPGRHWGSDYRVRDEIRRGWLRRTPPAPTGRGFVSGAAMLVDRASFERVGGFDEGYFLFYEDIDLCLRANELGIGTYVDRQWTVRHVGAHSTRSRFGQSLRWSYESAIRFHRRRGHPLVGYRVYVAVDAMLRGALRGLQGDRVGALAYAALLRRAAGEIVAPIRPGDGHGIAR